MNAHHNALKKLYGALYDEFAAILFRLDPALVNFDVNDDEYELEVGTILPRVINAQSAEELIPIMREELFRWFGSGLTNPTLTYEQLAGALFDALERHRGNA